jgi:hypothetical protein
MLWDGELPASQKNHQEETDLTISKAQFPDFIDANSAYDAYRMCEPKLADIGRIRLPSG